MDKLNQRLTLIANLSVVVGIIFLAVELQQNTQAVEAQTRDSIAQEEIELNGWIATNPELAEVMNSIVQGTSLVELSGTDATSARFLILAVLRAFENSYYQYESGLFDPDQFGPREVRWRQLLAIPAWREVWEEFRETVAPSFRAEIDRIVAEVGG